MLRLVKPVGEYRTEDDFFTCAHCSESFPLYASTYLGDSEYSPVLICPYCEDKFFESEDKDAFKLSCGVKVNAYY